MRSKRLALPFVAVAFAAIALAFQASASSKTKEVTFSRDVAPIFYNACVECHRPGEAAPMSLITYKEARPWARSIKEKVARREMPPWHADPHFGRFSNDRRLTQSQIDTIVAWVDGGAKEGNSKELPAVPAFVQGWSIGKPDIVLQMPEEFALEATGPDEYQYFEIETNFKEDKYVQMAEARPGNRAIVHHIIAFIQPPPKSAGQQRKLTKEQIEEYRAEMEKQSIFRREGFLMRMKPGVPVHDDGCAMAHGGNSERLDGKARDESDMGQLLCGYAPGMNAAIFEPGTVKKIPAGSKIILQMHYAKATGKAERDRSMVGLVFAKKPPEKQLVTRPVANAWFEVPPGAENHKVTACWTTKEDMHINTLMPHMHLRGKAMEIKAIYPDGRSEMLLNVPNYSFSWQTVYYLKEPARIPKGTKIIVTGYFDNSANNKYNPDPTKPVRFGEPTYDDMMIGWIEYTLDKSNGADKPEAASKASGK